MKKIVLTFGFIAGGMLALMMLATMPFHEKLLKSGLGEVVGYTTMVVALLMVFFGVRSYRDNVDPAMTFGRGFKVGILIALIASLCYVATWEIVYYTIAPDFAEKYAATIMEKERAAGASAEKLAATSAKMQEMARLYKNPLFNVGMTFMEIFPVGLLATVVSAAILRRRKGSAIPQPA